MSNATRQTHLPDEPYRTDDSADSPVAPAECEIDITTECVACVTATQFGWWKGSIPKGYTHCRDCHTSFPSSNRWGHCASCHGTFSGTVAWDLHQRTSGDGDIRPDCLCGALTAGAWEAALLGVHHQRKWAVGKSKTLVLRTAEWGAYWAQESDLFGVFSGGAQ